MRYLHFKYKYDINSTNFCDSRDAWELEEADTQDILTLIRQKQELLNDFPQLSTLGVIQKPGYFILRCFALGYVVLTKDEDFADRHIARVGIPMLQDSLSTRPNYFELGHFFDLDKDGDLLLDRVRYYCESDYDSAFKQHSSTVQSMKFHQRAILVGG